MTFKSPVLHHFEVCIEDEANILKLLTKGFGFHLWQERKVKQAHQWVLKSQNAIFMITKNLHNVDEKCTLTGGYPILRCGSGHNQHNDSVFNVALEVTNVQKITDSVRKNGGKVLHEPETLQDEHGEITFSVVESICPNVVHTLVEKSRYNGFLPGFYESNEEDIDKLESLKLDDAASVKYFDHVTFVCDIGQSGPLIQWYEKSFGMKRFLANRDETLEDGFVLADSIGLRLKALQYWRCSEIGVGSPTNANDPSKLNIVIAEPLPDVETSHVQTFLRENGGPGVQHIGLYTDSIVDSVAHMQNSVVKFRMPPYTYYEDFGHDELVRDIGLPEGLHSLEKHGILLDFEPSVDDNGDTAEDKWLMQIFTHPTFKKDTFFLEVIQRDGATGFGSGNITALARSIVRYNQEMDKQKSMIDERTSKKSIERPFATEGITAPNINKGQSTR